jgi:hypothetical protein
MLAWACRTRLTGVSTWCCCICGWCCGGCGRLRAAPASPRRCSTAEPLAQALCKNILDGGDIGRARQLAAYANAVIAALAGLDDASAGNGSWRFPSPARFAAAG